MRPSLTATASAMANVASTVMILPLWRMRSESAAIRGAAERRMAATSENTRAGITHLHVWNGNAARISWRQSTVQMRVMRRDDIPAGLRLCRRANWNQVAADWEVFLASNPDGCRVAIDDSGEVVGSVATLRYGDEFTWIAMVLVDPPHRGKGLGTRLLKEALTIIGEATTARLDATPAGRAVYVPLGFREEYPLQRMERPAMVRLSAVGRATQPSFGETDLRARRMSDADFADVAKYHRDVFGADRRGLLEMCRGEAPEYAWAIGDGRLGGYLFGRHGYSFEQIGPLVARDEPTARTL